MTDAFTKTQIILRCSGFFYFDLVESSVSCSENPSVFRIRNVYLFMAFYVNAQGWFFMSLPSSHNFCLIVMREWSKWSFFFSGIT